MKNSITPWSYDSFKNKFTILLQIFKILQKNRQLM